MARREVSADIGSQIHLTTGLEWAGRDGVSADKRRATERIDDSALARRLAGDLLGHHGAQSMGLRIVLEQAPGE